MHDTVEIDEVKAEVIRRVFRDYLEGESATAIALLVYAIVIIVKTRRNPLTQELYTDHKAF